MLNTPIFRAKKQDSDEYVEGYLKYDKKYNHYCINPIDEHNYWFVVDQTTLAIHFPDTNIKDLFFGLENGKGASIIEAIFIDDKRVLNSTFKGIAVHTHHGYIFFDKNNDWVHITNLKNIKVVGIQK